MAQAVYWPSGLSGWEPGATGWRLGCPLLETPVDAPTDRLRVDGLHMRMQPTPPTHAVTCEAMIARQWVVPIGADRAQVHVELRHTVVVRPGGFALWVDQVSSKQYHHYVSAVEVAGTLVGHDRDVRHVVVRDGAEHVKVALAADYDARIVEGDGRVRVDLHLRGHNTRFLVAAFRGADPGVLEACTVRVADGPVVEVHSTQGRQWVLHSNSLRRLMWTGAYQTDARWATLDPCGQLVLADVQRVTGPNGQALMDEARPLTQCTLDVPAQSSP